MKIKPNLIAAACVIVVAVAAQAAEPSRTAKIEDTSGVKTDVTEFQCSFSGSSRFSGAYDCVSITTSSYEVAIPASRLISITCSGNSAEVTYHWRGLQRTISGTLDAKFGGKSDFGGFELSSSKLRQLSFSEPPPPEKVEQRYGTPYPASVMLTNGTAITFSNLARHDSYYSSEGYLIGGSTRYNHYTDFRFMRGESLATLEFATLRKLEFGAPDSITVTLTNGNAASGKLSSTGGAGVDGWTGETEQGLVFLQPSMVRTVEFGLSSTDKKPKASFESAPKANAASGGQSSFDKLPANWPKATGVLNGDMEVRVKNPNDFRVRVGLRTSGKGKDFVLSPSDTESVRVPNGRYDIYFNYSSDPEGLYQGDSFTLNGKGVEIQIVKVVDGNYGIRKVK